MGLRIRLGFGVSLHCYFGALADGLAVMYGQERPWSELAGPSRGKTFDLGSGQFQVEIRARRDNEELTEGMRAIGR